MLTAVARHVPGLDTYGPCLDAQGQLGHGRIRASQEGVIFQHLLILRRELVQQAGRNFSDVEAKVAAKLKRQKLGELDFLTLTLVTYALFLAECTGNVALWVELRDTIAAWQIS